MSACNGLRCDYSMTLPGPASYTLQVRAVLFNTTGEASVVSWEYKRCAASEYAVLSNGDAIACLPCPEGGDCTPPNATALVQQSDIVAQAGWWASSTSDGLTYYRCPIAEACLQGSPSNGTRSACARGYGHVACSLCVRGYFEQFGKCVACPSSTGSSVAALLGIVLVLIACGIMLWLMRSVLPIDVLKLGVSMVQIIASANSAYDIPWPAVFGGFLSSLRVFLVDVVSLTRASCTQPMNYYASMMVVLIGLKLALGVLLLGPWLWSRLQRRGCGATRAVNRHRDRRRLTAVEERMRGRRQSELNQALATALHTMQSTRASIEWSKVF